MRTSFVEFKIDGGVDSDNQTRLYMFVVKFVGGLVDGEYAHIPVDYDAKYIRIDIQGCEKPLVAKAKEIASKNGFSCRTFDEEGAYFKGAYAHKHAIYNCAGLEDFESKFIRCLQNFAEDIVSAS